MDKTKSVQIIERQIERINEIRNKDSGSPEFAKWHRDTEVAIENIFVDSSRHKDDFNNIGYSVMVWSDSTPESAFEKAFQRGLDEATSILNSFIDEINEYWGEEVVAEAVAIDGSVDQIQVLCDRFHLVARQISTRHDNRSTIEINDEYDVQDLFHSLLRLFYEDIRDEEWAPSYAGGASRMDFLLPEEETVIEIKKTRDGLKEKQLGEQLIVDIEKYQSHPQCKKLVCFVYDPEEKIKNPRGIERDLNRSGDTLEVVVMIRPSGT